MLTADIAAKWHFSWGATAESELFVRCRLELRRVQFNQIRKLHISVGSTGGPRTILTAFAIQVALIILVSSSFLIPCHTSFQTDISWFMEAEVKLGHARTYLHRRTGEHFFVLLFIPAGQNQTPQYGEKPRHSLLDRNSIQNIWCDPPTCMWVLHSGACDGFAGCGCHSYCFIWFSSHLDLWRGVKSLANAQNTLMSDFCEVVGILCQPKSSEGQTLH